MDHTMLKLRKLGIDTYKESVIYMREDCHVCKAEGFETHARIRVDLGENSIIATLNIITSDLLSSGEIGLSDHAWKQLKAEEGAAVVLSHPKPVSSLSHVRSKIYGNALDEDELSEIVHDIVADRYSDIEISSFLTACAGGRLIQEEITSLTRAMVVAGDRLDWGQDIVVDKHCVGGLPGNRTTPIVVAIVAAHGLIMPKTSSRAITSPAGTADTMEVLAPVELDVPAMKKVVEQEGGCIVWGGSVSLSPADDILIRVEKALDLDSEGQLVASVLSKKIAAGSTHVLIDVPIGITAKVRSREMADELKSYLETTAEHLHLGVTIHFSDGTQPIGRGIGPALEARDVLAVLQNKNAAPEDLKDQALTLAGRVIEFSPDVSKGEGKAIASFLLSSGKAWKKFQAICEAQGGMRNIPSAPHTHPVTAETSGIIKAIDNRRIAKVAKLAGAPLDKVAGVDLHTPVGTAVETGQPLFTVHAESPGELDYALGYLSEEQNIIEIEEE